MKKFPIIPLGCTPDGRSVYFDEALGIVRHLSPAQHKDTVLRSIATYAEWLVAIRQYGAALNHIHDERRVDFVRLAEYLQKKCREKGLFDSAQVRGRGNWPHSSGAIVTNTGAELVCTKLDGTVSVTSLVGIEPTPADPHRYLRSPIVSGGPASEEARAEDCRFAVGALSHFAFGRGVIDAELVFGWCACAPILTLLDFRPHIAITAARGAGKSTLLRCMAESILGRRNVLRMEADGSTEPGLRQKLGSDAIALIADEFETTSASSQAMLDLLRIASNPHAGSIFKGTPEGRAIQYEVHTSACIAGIAINFRKPADASRFAMIEVEKRPHSEAERRALIEAFEALGTDYSLRLTRRMILRRGQLQVTLATFRFALRQNGADDRQADLYGHLLAGYWTACNDAPVTFEEATDKVRGLRFEAFVDELDRGVLDHLLGFEIQVDGVGRISLGQLLADVRTAAGDHIQTKDLEAFGVRYCSDDDHVIIANRVPSILRVFGGSSYRDGQHVKALKRIGGDDNEGRTVRFGPFSPCKVRRIPASVVFGDEEE